MAYKEKFINWVGNGYFSNFGVAAYEIDNDQVLLRIENVTAGKKGLEKIVSKQFYIDQELNSEAEDLNLMIKTMNMIEDKNKNDD